MNTGITKFFMLVAVTMMTMMVWTGHAAARDGKSYPGLMCSDQYGPNTVRSQVKYTPSGAVYNPTPNVITVRCLIVKDDTLGKGGIDEVTVHYADYHSTRKLTCAVEARKLNHSRSGLRIRLKKVTESSPTGIKVGSMTMYGPTITGSKWSYYFLTCALPPKAKSIKIGRMRVKGTSMLHSYTVIEHGNGNG